MKNLGYLLLIPILYLSCSPEDKEPPVLEEQPLIVGLSGQDNVQYFSSQTVSFNSGNEQGPDMNVVAKEVDVNEDGTVDLRFYLTTLVDIDAQVLKVSALNGTELAWRDQRFELDNDSFSHLQMLASGESLEVDAFNWTSSQSLFMFYQVRNQSLSAGSFLSQSGYLPIQLNDQLGWVEIKAQTNGSTLEITGIDIIEAALQ